MLCVGCWSVNILVWFFALYGGGTMNIVMIVDYPSRIVWVGMDKMIGCNILIVFSALVYAVLGAQGYAAMFGGGIRNPNTHIGTILRIGVSVPANNQATLGAG